MTLSSSSGSPDGLGPETSGGKKPKVDQDIRNHPLYKTPWWRKPLKPWMFWTLASVLVAILVAAVIVCISLGIKLF
ncbi:MULTISPECIES: hypothetical protein [Subtercola]|uniref:Uncharacterized protein n=1 Tax=Subtercola vilae TaxID=2056433 RepID=A0A4T2BYF5_9MICO|nr:MULTISPECIES: hypothetical protein [Subtercola]MEA9986892.1 hypothetical protein [Subtercola sp. RTI3]TIH34638.1 hypothetical protein D4765_12525 [Subtercola vilae]